MPDEKEIFFEALQLAGDERERYIDENCGDDTSLRARVQNLLDAHEHANVFMGSPTAGSGRAVAAPEKSGSQIDHYRLIKQIGEGGFGTVFMADQEHPVSRKVALKIIKMGMDTERVISRFETERQALAIMDHPGIAKVFDAGVTQSGRPYFVMEFVNGEPITDYCDRKGLTIRDRLDLFRDVCLAVEHAHQKGVIHRDIKPTNVLVTTIDGKPTPKVIDFGVAKAAGAKLTERADVTREHQLVGTPQYMSPEQASLSGIDIDTRSDVYALGVLLYELLVGVAPFEAERLQEASLAQLERIICSEDPAIPSTRVCRLGKQLVHAAHARQSEPGKLRKALRGDLDWITMRAMEKDRERRYQAAWALAEDVRRYSARLPVDAGPPSRVYKLRKFANRHRLELGAAMVVFGALVAAIVILFIGNARTDGANRIATTELQKYDAIMSFVDTLFEGISPARGKDTELMEQVIRTASERIEERSAGRAEVEVPLRRLIGTAYYSIAKYEEAEGQFKRAVSLARSELGPRERLTLDAENDMIGLLGMTSRFEEAVTLGLDVLEKRIEVDGKESPETLRTMADLGHIYGQLGQYERARDLFAELVRVREKVLGAGHEDTISAKNGLAVQWSNLNYPARAGALLEDVLENQRAQLGGDHPHTLATMSNLAGVYEDLGRESESLALLRESLRIKEQILPPGHQSVIIGMNNLADVLEDTGEFAEAEGLYRDALARSKETFGLEHMATVTLMNNLSSLLAKQERLEEAIPLAEEGAEIMTALVSPDHPRALISANNLGGMYIAAGRYEEALEIAERTTVVGRQKFASNTKLFAGFVRIHGEALAGVGRFDEALPYLGEANTLYLEHYGAEHERYQTLVQAYVDLYERWGKVDEAREWEEKLE